MSQSKNRITTTVTIDQVSKTFGKLRALKDVNLHIERGEFFTLLGPSGCGKTTLLRSIAGFERPDCGKILFNEDNVTSLPPWEKHIGFVFQNYALWPNMTVFQNVAYGLNIRKRPADEIKEKVQWALNIVDLPGIERKFPEQLSGGQQQRVAIARALVIDPQILLLDEPLSNLDAKLRISLRKQIREIQKHLSLTVVYVTHDQEEALEISDRIAVMNLGEVQQVGPPEEIYEEPLNIFVADFVGKANFLKGALASSGEFTAEGDLRIQLDSQAESLEEPLTLMVRPEKIQVVSADEQWHLQGRIQRKFYLGNIKRYEVEIKNGQIILLETLLNIAPNEDVYLQFTKYQLI